MLSGGVSFFRNEKLFYFELAEELSVHIIVLLLYDLTLYRYIRMMD